MVITLFTQLYIQDPYLTPSLKRALVGHIRDETKVGGRWTDAQVILYCSCFLRLFSICSSEVGSAWTRSMVFVSGQSCWAPVMMPNGIAFVHSRFVGMHLPAAMVDLQVEEKLRNYRRPCRDWRKDVAQAITGACAGAAMATLSAEADGAAAIDDVEDSMAYDALWADEPHNNYTLD